MENLITGVVRESVRSVSTREHAGPRKSAPALQTEYTSSGYLMFRSGTADSSVTGAEA